MSNLIETKTPLNNGIFLVQQYMIIWQQLAAKLGNKLFRNCVNFFGGMILPFFVSVKTIQNPFINMILIKRQKKMLVTFISQCEKRSLNKTRRVHDAFANRIGSRTWQTHITEEGLQAAFKMLTILKTPQ